MKKLGLATAVLLAMTSAHAYQVEVQGQSEYVDTTENDKNFTGALQGTYYFKNVDDSKGPLAEAAFLNQASNFSLAYNYGQYDAPVAGGRSDIEAHTYGAKAEVYLPTPYAPAYASASYSHTHLDGKNAVTPDDQGDRWALEVGSVIAPNFLVAVGYTNVADQTALDAFQILNGGIVKAAGEAATIGQDQDAITARTKYVGNIADTNMAVGFESGIVFGDDTAYQLKTDFYVNPKLSVGASYAESNFDNTPDSAWGVNVNYFITPSIAVGADYVNADASEANLDTQTVGLNAKLRF